MTENQRLVLLTPFFLFSVSCFLTLSLEQSCELRAAAKGRAQQVVFQDSPIVIAHRGDSATHPENTLPAFRSAIEAKADMIELDYYHSRDGIPFTFHDSTLDRTTNVTQKLGLAKVPTGSLTWAKLQGLDAGLWKNKQFQGTKIPTLLESLDTIQQGSVTLIERKKGDAETAVALLQKHKLVADVVVQAFDWDYLENCHKLCPDLILGALGKGEFAQSDIAKIKLAGAQVVGWSYKDVTPEMIKLIHTQGWKLWVYTVNDPAEATNLVTAGIDGIITDTPKQIRGVLKLTK
jgi:glycerophosphoryl diester phosphodiesterase